jgi:hypothetical protein
MNFIFSTELSEVQYDTPLWMLGVAIGEIAHIDEKRIPQCISITSRINLAHLELIPGSETEACWEREADQSGGL